MKALAAALLASLPAVAGAQEIAAAYDAKRCVNIGNDLERPKGASWGARAHTVADLEKIKAAGFDTVRIPVRWDDYAADEEPYTIDAEFFERVDALVEPALTMDLNVILNIHHFDEVMEEPRANARKFLGLWRQIASHYKDAPDSLWYETLNEPRDALEGDLMRSFQDVAVKGIREIDPERIIILMGDNWSSIRSLETNMEAPDENIVFSFHYYDPFDFTHQGAEWLGDGMPKGKRGWGNTDDRQALKRDADIAAAFAEATGHPVFLGEIGVNSAAKNRERVKYMGAVTEEMEKRDIAWCIWAYTNTFSLHTDDKGWDKAALKALGLNAP